MLTSSHWQNQTCSRFSSSIIDYCPNQRNNQEEYLQLIIRSWTQSRTSHLQGLKSTPSTNCGIRDQSEKRMEHFLSIKAKVTVAPTLTFFLWMGLLPLNNHILGKVIFNWTIRLRIGLHSDSQHGLPWCATRFDTFIWNCHEARWKNDTNINKWVYKPPFRVICQCIYTIYCLAVCVNCVTSNLLNIHILF